MEMSADFADARGFFSNQISEKSASTFVFHPLSSAAAFFSAARLVAEPVSAGNPTQKFCLLRFGFIGVIFL